MSDTSLSNDIWAGKYGGPRGALQRSKEKYRNLMAKGEVVDASCSLASAYYSAATGEIPRIKKCRIFAFVRGVWHLYRAYALAKYLVNFWFERLNADRLDILQSIFRACRQYRLARRVIDRGLQHCKIPEYSAKIHTFALLEIGNGYLLLRDGQEDAAQYAFDFALRVAPQVEEYDPRQASRIYRHCGRFFLENGREYDASRCFSKAVVLAKESGATDQVAKIQATQ